MRSLQKYDYLIIGAGAIGACCAILLAKFSDKKVALIGTIQPPDTSQRSYALNRISERILTLAGVWQVAKPSAYNSMKVYDLESSAQLDYQATSFDEDNLGHIVTDKTLLEAIQVKLPNQSRLDWINTQVVDIQTSSNSDSIDIFTKDQSIFQANLVIAADGKHSQAAKLIGIHTDHKATNDSSLVCNLASQYKHGNCARQWFSNRSIIALLPMADDHHLSLVWSTAMPSASDFIKDPRKLADSLTKATLGELGKLDCISKPILFPITEHALSSYYQGNVVFIGDSAHSVHPLAGKGMNMGLHDCLILVDELVNGVNNKPLFSYQQRRQLDNNIDLALMRTLRLAFRSNNPIIKFLRGKAMQIFNTRVLDHKVINLALYGTTSRQQLDKIISNLTNGY